MADRIVRQAILTSDRVDALGAGPAEVFYRRLMNVVDDYGRYDGRISVIKAACYPLRLAQTREADISRWLAMCVKAGLIVLYEVEGKPYLELLNLGEPRAKYSKYPPPPASASICTQTQEDVPPYALRLTPIENSNEPADANSLPSPQYPVFPTVAGKKTKEHTWTLPDSLVEQLAKAFLGVDVPAQCRAAHMWALANPAKRKTASGMPEFLRRWMVRQQNDHPRRTTGQGAAPRPAAVPAGREDY